MSYPRRKKRGLTVLEMLVVTALMGLISAFTMVLYTTAVGDFESSSTTTSLVRYARKVTQKVALVVSTATNRTETSGTFADTTIDNKSLGNGTPPAPAINFLSTGNFIKTATTECPYAFDDGDTVVPGYTELYRYQIAWNPPTSLATASNPNIPSLPPNCVYMERRTIVNNLSGIPLDTRGTLMPGTYRQNLGPNVGNCQFQYVLGNTMQMRITVYSVDPITGRGIDGQLMRKLNKRHRQDVATGGDKSYELLTSMPIPTSSIK
jgi:prepilin-type N-terminal cleavage/methylation domain-containing protein